MSYEHELVILRRSVWGVTPPPSLPPQPEKTKTAITAKKMNPFFIDTPKADVQQIMDKVKPLNRQIS